MNTKRKTSSLCSARRGLTLLEVVAAIAILGSVLVGLVLAKAKHARQLALAQKQSQAARLIDDLVASWWANGAGANGVPVGATGAIGADGAWAWETRLVDNPAIEKLGARVVRVEVRDCRTQPGESGRSPNPADAVVVDLVLPGEGAAMKGFTLLEMLLATALLSVLMVGVLAVIATLGPAKGGNGPGFPGASPAAEALDAWVTLLGEDLSQSRDASSRENAVELSGHVGLDDRSRQRSHRMVRVQYALEDVDGRRWLVRRQSALDVPTNQNVQRDLVCGGVNRFVLARVESVPAAPPPEASPAARARPDGSGVWRLRVWMDDREQPGYERLVAAYPKGER